MRGTRLAVATVLTLSFVTTSSAAGATTADPATADLSTTTTVSAGVAAETNRFRAAVDLPASASLMAQLASDPSADRTWAVPLTTAEAAEVSRRAALPAQAAAAIAWASGQPTYAGAYIDHAAGGVLVFMFADPDVSAERAAVASRAPVATTLDVRTASASLSDLESLRGAVNADRDWFGAVGVALVSTGMDTANNALLVGVDPYSSTVDAAVHARFGPHVLSVAMKRASRMPAP